MADKQVRMVLLHTADNRPLYINPAFVRAVVGQNNGTAEVYLGEGDDMAFAVRESALDVYLSVDQPNKSTT